MTPPAGSSPNALPNSVIIGPRLTTSAQPTPSQLARLAADGYAVVIHLVPAALLAATHDESLILSRQGIHYVRIAVDPEALARADQQAFSAALLAAAPRRVLVHCDVNSLASAFVAVHRVIHDAADLQQVRDALTMHGVPRGALHRFIVERLGEVGQTLGDL